MADTEDDTEYGQHFLDSMLEVEMTEEDGEVDIPKSENISANNNVLPPIPTVSDWACFCYAQKPLWLHRAICRALIEFIEKRKTNLRAPVKDTTTCCNISSVNRNRGKTLIKNALAQEQKSLNSPAFCARSTFGSENKMVVHKKPVSGKEHSILKYTLQGKSQQEDKVPVGMDEFGSFGARAFVEDNLQDSFKLTKLLLDKFSDVKEKISSRTTFTGENVLASAVKKLHRIYEKSSQLLNELNKNLLEDFAMWKAHVRTTLGVIDLPDEETKSSSGKLKKKSKSSIFFERCKNLLLNDDSDVEGLEVTSNKSRNKLKRMIAGKAINGYPRGASLTTCNAKAESKTCLSDSCRRVGRAPGLYAKRKPGTNRSRAKRLKTEVKV
ncbi:hypothetical protein RUM43_014137 [Polyplax serrata]|uniref:Uncharacterized protein n=1 Tax=Polyplax serrata TaxID=468196 RepID=A0AAN8NQ89_POLSC